MCETLFLPNGRKRSRRQKRATQRSAGPNTGSDTKGIIINGRCIIDATPGASILQVNLSPMSGGVNLGAYNSRMASEADLWQEFRFTKLKIYYLPNETPGNRNQCSVVGFVNVYPNYSVANVADVVQLPSSHVFALGGAGTAYPTSSIGTRQVWNIPRAALLPAHTPWLMCYNGSGIINSQGAIFGYFNYTSSTGPNVWMYVEWECEFRNPVPAGTTLVLSKNSPSFRNKLIEALESEEKEDARQRPSTEDGRSQFTVVDDDGLSRKSEVPGDRLAASSTRLDRGWESVPRKVKP